MLHHDFRRAFSDQQAPALTTLGSQIDQPIGSADHIQVVLDHDQGMSGIKQAAQGPHQLRDVVKVQTGGGLVKQKKHAFAGQGLFA